MSFRDKLEPDLRLNIYLHLGELIAKRSVLVVRKPSLGVYIFQANASLKYLGVIYEKYQWIYGG